MVALTALVGSATDVPVICTTPPTGTIAGATYVVVPPLTVSAGPKNPQSLEPQTADQRTPALVTSLVSEAFICVLVPTCSEAGGAGANATVMG